MPDYAIAQLGELPFNPGPCGFAQRASADLPGAAAGLHLVLIKADARAQYPQRMTDINLMLQGEGEIELDGQRHPVKSPVRHNKPQSGMISPTTGRRSTWAIKSGLSKPTTTTRGDD